MSSGLNEWDPVSQAFITALNPAVDFVNQFGFIGESTHFVKLPQVDNALLPTAASLGMDLMLFKYTISLLLVYPLAFIMYQLPGKSAKHAFSFLTGFLMVQWIFGPDWIHTFITSFITYLLTISIRGKSMPIIVFIFVMGYMTLAHIYKMHTSYLSGIFDFTGTQMVLTMKLTSYAYNVFDGVYDAKNVFAAENDGDRAVLSKRRYAVRKHPSLLEFFGYIFCFTCILCGPAFEYADYAAAMDNSAFVVPSADKDKKVIKRPNMVWPAVQRLVTGLVCMVLYLQLSPVYKLSTLYDPVFIASHTYLERALHVLLAMFAERQKYYFAWKIAEGASILAGFGFEGYDEKGVAKGFSGVENMDIIGFETATTISTSTRVWNKRTQGWLERYTYNRTGRSLFVTYFVSSLWHGLYPGFFCVFLSMPLVTEVERLFRAKVNPILLPGYDPKKPNETFPKTPVAYIYVGLCWAGTILTINYVAQTFSMGSAQRSLAALSSLHYAGHAAFAAFFVLLSLLPGPKKDKSADKKKA